jgi:hypothetical protein
MSEEFPFSVFVCSSPRPTLFLTLVKDLYLIPFQGFLGFSVVCKTSVAIAFHELKINHRGCGAVAINRPVGEVKVNKNYRVERIHKSSSRVSLHEEHQKSIVEFFESLDCH